MAFLPSGLVYTSSAATNRKKFNPPSKQCGLETYKVISRKLKTLVLIANSIFKGTAKFSGGDRYQNILTALLCECSPPWVLQ